MDLVPSQLAVTSGIQRQRDRIGLLVSADLSNYEDHSAIFEKYLERVLVILCQRRFENSDSEAA
jgi:hypothetical protein